MPVRNGRDQAGSVGRSRRHERGDQRRHRRVLRYGINPKTALRFPSGLRAGWIGRRPGSRPRRSLPPLRLRLRMPGQLF
jgi:hypothetical protein